jgi:predicted house-cleaning noncanonical NTP pyrophosphatase (MazG superfamily)
VTEADGHRAVTRVLQEEDYRAALLAKLAEEAREAENAPDDELASELAETRGRSALRMTLQAKTRPPLSGMGQW